MNDDEYVKQMLAMKEKLGDDIYYTIKDEDGIVRPLAGLWASDGYGKDAAEERAAKIHSTVVAVRITEV